MAKSTAAVLLFALTVACGGAIDGQPAQESAEADTREPNAKRTLLTGVLAGNAAGIHYRTQQLEGLTDVSGAFTYYAGETVSFHVGGIQLGSATASPTLDLFRLNGAPAPASEIELVNAVLDEATITGFDRATNAAMVLLAFDRDDDVRNGIDLGDVDRALTAKRLTLERDLVDFPALLAAYAQRAGVAWNNVESADAVAYIYAALGVRIPAHARHVISSDYELANPAHDWTQTKTYDGAGRLTTSEDVAVDPLSGKSRTTYTRDDRGREIRQEIAGTSRTRVLETRRDNRGQAVLVTESILEGALLRYSRTDELSVDAAGRVYAYELRTDLNGDAAADERGSGSYTYEATTARYQTTFDSNVSTPYRSDIVLQFDDNGLVAGRHDAQDDAMDGVDDFEYAGEFVRDSRGTLWSAKEARRSSADATPQTATLVYTRDTQGSVVRIETTYEGSPRHKTLEIYFDAAHRTLGETTIDDTNGDGVADMRNVVEVRRDGDGNITSRETVSSVLVNGVEVPTGRWLFAQVFDGRAPLVHIERADNDGDGVFDGEASHRYEYTIIPDGVRYIVANAKEWSE